MKLLQFCNEQPSEVTLARPSQLDYSTISSTGRSCPGRDSCRQHTGRSTRGPDTVEMDWKKRNCFCDNSCALYGDCCIDAPAFAQREQMVRTAEEGVTREGGRGRHTNNTHTHNQRFH